MTMMDEMLIISGEKIINGSISYVPQDAWVMSTTLRENIVMNNTWDAEKYQLAVKHSALIQVIHQLEFIYLYSVYETLRWH